MIRAALVLALLAAPAAAQELPGQALCESILEKATDLAAAVFSVTGEVSPSAMEGCLYTDLRIDIPGDYTPDWRIDSLQLTGAVDWIAAGSPPPGRLGLRLKGLRMLVRTGNPQVDYLFAAQVLGNLVDADLDLAWDAAARVLAVERLDIDFPGENRVSLTAQVAGVDLSSVGAMQMSATSFAVTEADLMVQSHGLFEWYLLMPLGAMVLPTEGDMEAAARVLRADAVAGVAALPEASFPPDSKAALTDLVQELPNPSGVLTVSFRAKAGFGPARLMGFAITGVPASMEAAAPLLDGVTLDIGWTHEDRP